MKVWNFNEMLINEVVSFEPPDPEWQAVQTLTRLPLFRQSDLGLHCRPQNIHI